MNCSCLGRKPASFSSAFGPFYFMVNCAAVIWSVYIYYYHCHPLWAFSNDCLKYYYYFNTFINPWERFSYFLLVSDFLNFSFERECLFSGHFFHVPFSCLDVCLLFLQLSLFCAKWSRTVSFFFRNSSSLYLSNSVLPFQCHNSPQFLRSGCALV